MMPEARVAPPVSTVEAARIARDLYGLMSAAHPLPGEYDDNFLLQSADGRRFVLKVMHPAREEAFIDMQCRALIHIAERAPGLALPRVVPSVSSDLFSRVQLDDGSARFVWLLSYLPGQTLASTKPHSAELLASVGAFLAQLDTALLDFTHPATARDLKWNIADSLWARDYLTVVEDHHRRELAGRFLDLFEREAIPLFPALRRSVIYGDANDHNILVSAPGPQPRQVLSVIDFGDMHCGLLVGELAVACAYAALHKEHPLAAVLPVVAGYHKVLPLREEEIAALFPLICARLGVSVINSAYRRSLLPDDPYVTVSEGPAWAALARLANLHPRLARYSFRSACGGLRELPELEEARSWLAANGGTSASIIPSDLRAGDCLVLDLSVGSPLVGVDPAHATESRMTPKIGRLLSESGASVAIGQYNEPRSVYSSSLFQATTNPTDERRTIHLGIDLFVEPGTAVFAPFDATVHAFADNPAPQDYGPVVILRHRLEGGAEFFTLYGHLSRESLKKLQVGQQIFRSTEFARIGGTKENGGWTPHLHFQIVLDLLDLSTDFPGVAFASERDVYTSLSPDPNLVLGIPGRVFPRTTPNASQTLSARKELLGRNLSISYKRPLKIVKGWRQYLYDDTGRAFLDVYNNVPLVGHSHPRVVSAIQEQVAVLNTNTRYLHDNVNRYAQRLTEILPSPLRVCYFVNSGSEANELALRLARAFTDREDVIVLEHAYHGHTSTLIDMSPYKFNGPGGSGRRPWVHVAPIADDYRGRHRRGEENLGRKYAQTVAETLENARREGRSVAAFIAETLPSVAGQIVFPPEYLRQVYAHVREAGGVCIADEVQVGFGRLGSHFWGFETQNVVPDIVVLGKPIANGFPCSAVVTTREIAAAFASGMEFFSTFGGNPVSCAAGLAVLDILRDEHLQQNALKIGSAWLADLADLQPRFPLIGDVRGLGLFLGLDLVSDRESRAPATRQADYIVNRLREKGILAGTDGPHHNVMKLRPPLIFSREDACRFTSALTEVLEEDPAQPG